MVNKNTDENQYIEFYIQGMKKTPIITLLQMVGSGMSVMTQEKNLEFIINNSSKISVQQSSIQPEQQVSVRIN